MTPSSYRLRVKDAIVSTLRLRDQIVGCWEGGSAATGRLDEFSDIDLMIVAPLEEADAIFAAVEAAIANVGAISHRWHVDPPPFPDTSQRFYFLDGAPPFFAVDCVVVKPTAIAQFLERERHGEPQIQFDRTGQICALPLDRAALAARRARRLRQLHGAVPVYRALLEKELTRAHPLEAFGFYQALLRALIELLRMRYQPERFDYGWRYVETELPEEARRLLERYAFVANHDRLRRLSSSLGDELQRQLEFAASKDERDN